MIALPVIEEIEGITVVRDDLVQGGTKRRVLAPLLVEANEFVYASPASGYAQIALAYACQEARKRATIFVAKRAVLHTRTRQAKEAGAKIVEVAHGYLSNVQAKARAYAEMVGAALLPFGFDYPEFRQAVTALALRLPVTPREVWSVAGSGTLTRSLQQAWPYARFYAVRIGHMPDAGRAEILEAPERFESPARDMPPFPSCANYDAKAWRFVKSHRRPGVLFWNVAA